jgi:hypothetical protein
MYDLETAWVAVQLALAGQPLHGQPAPSNVPTLPYVVFEPVRLTINSGGFTVLTNATTVPVTYAAVHWQGPIFETVDALGLQIAKAFA